MSYHSANGFAVSAPVVWRSPSTNVSRMTDADWEAYKAERAKQREIEAMGDALMGVGK